jgi:hypothetical protein
MSTQDAHKRGTTRGLASCNFASAVRRTIEAVDTRALALALAVRQRTSVSYANAVGRSDRSAPRSPIGPWASKVGLARVHHNSHSRLSQCTQGAALLDSTLQTHHTPRRHAAL